MRAMPKDVASASAPSTQVWNRTNVDGATDGLFTLVLLDLGLASTGGVCDAAGLPQRAIVLGDDLILLK